MVGETVRHYKIIEKLGGGGMGVVYKAEDTKLKRTIALKFLPPELTRDPDSKKRFINEAQAASALQHINICTIHDIDETEDGQMYIIMDYYEGETLKEKLKSGGLEIELSMEYALQIANGLQEAHKKGIIHRDIKPANIIITGKGEVKILDFGLAKSGEHTKLTKTGTTVGTVAYMSPEQAWDGEIDQRTDIWSLGVVLYEMITGQLPFKGQHEQIMLYAIMNEEPKPINDLRAGVPIELESIVNKCLAKQPTDRYQYVGEIEEDLRFLKDEPTVKNTRLIRLDKKLYFKIALSILLTFITVIIIIFIDQEAESKTLIPIAVVDFENKTGEKELDGLSGMLTTALEQSSRLSVITRSRMFDLMKQMGVDENDKIDERLGREIAKYAQIKILITASISKFDRLYNIDLKVLHTDQDVYIFTASEKGEGTAKIPIMIDNLAESTREALKENSDDIKKNSRSIGELTTENITAYNYYYKGEEYLSKAKMYDAERQFIKATVFDSSFGLAYYKLAYVLDIQKDDYEARFHIEKALKLVDSMPKKVKYMVRALYSKIIHGYKEGIAVLKLMENDYSDDIEILYLISKWSYSIHDFNTAERYLVKILSFDPKSERALADLWWVSVHQKKQEKMKEYAHRYYLVTGNELRKFEGEEFTYVGTKFAVKRNLKYMESVLDSSSRYARLGLTHKMDKFTNYALVQVPIQVRNLMSLYKRDELINDLICTQDSTLMAKCLVAWIFVRGERDIDFGLEISEQTLESISKKFIERIRLVPFFTIPEYTMGLAYFMKSEYDKSLQYFEQSAKLLPNRRRIFEDLSLVRSVIR